MDGKWHSIISSLERKLCKKVGLSSSEAAYSNNQPPASGLGHGSRRQTNMYTIKRYTKGYTFGTEHV
jgi:hypothetical protein